MGNYFNKLRWKIITANTLLQGHRTVLMKDCPLKWPEQSFEENDIFSMKKIVGSTLDLSTKAVFSFDKYQLKNMGWKLCFCYSTYRKSFTEVLPPRDQTNHFAYSCSFTFHTSYKNGMIGHGGGTLSKCSKTLYYKKHIRNLFCKSL